MENENNKNKEGCEFISSQIISKDSQTNGNHNNFNIYYTDPSEYKHPILECHQ